MPSNQSTTADAVTAHPPIPAVRAPRRRVYVDVLRGVAVLFMILWHSVDAWHVRDGRTTTSFMTIAFLAGWAAPMFLFLAGVSLPMAGQARMARGASRRAASRALIVRGFEVFVIAHLFRFQSFLLNPNGRWNGLLRPDILNILGVGLMAAAWAWQYADSTKRRFWWLALPAAIVVFVLAPLAPSWWWPTLLHPRLEAYIRPVPGQGVFSLFPPVGYLFAGAWLGAVLVEGEHDERRLHAWMFVGGMAFVAAGIALALVPLPRPVQWWLNHATVFIWRAGAMAASIALAWWLLGHRSLHPANPLVVFGRTSLFVYWVHVELAYGIFGHPLRYALPLPWALVAYALLTTAMYGLAVLWLRRPAGPLIPAHLRPGMS